MFQEVDDKMDLVICNYVVEFEDIGKIMIFDIVEIY